MVLLIVNLLPRRRRQVLIACVAVAVAPWLGWWVYQIVRDAHGDGDGQNAVHQVLGHFTFSGVVLTPDALGGARPGGGGPRRRKPIALGPRPGLEQRPFRISDCGARGAAPVSPGP